MAGAGTRTDRRGVLDGRARRLHPASPVLDLVLSVRQWLFPLIFIILSSRGSVITAPLLALAVVALVGFKVLTWSRFSYQLSDDVLRIDQGVLNRRHREVPRRRIQQVDLQRKLRHRALGVAVVRIDTAGGGSDAEVVLEAIADDEALALRSALLTPAPGSDAEGDGDERHGRSATGVPAGGPPEVVTELSTRQLALAGLTGSRLAAILPLVGAGFGLLVELPDSTAQSATETVGDQLSSTRSLIALAVLVIPVIGLLAAGTSILTDHEFTLVRRGTDLHLRRGLLDQREATLSLQRIQVVRILDNPLRRGLGLVRVELQSAGSGSSADGRVSRLTIPLVETGAIGPLLDHVMPGAARRPDLVAAPPAARRRAWVRRLVPALLVVALLVLVTRSWWALLATLALVPAAALAEAAYRGLGHAVTDSFVFARRGGLFRELVVVPVAKTQSSRLHSSPFQRRVGLATLELDVAGKGRTPAVVDGARERLAPLCYQALYAHDARVDEQAVRRRNRSQVDAADEIGDRAVGVTNRDDDRPPDRAGHDQPGASRRTGSMGPRDPL